MVTEKQNGAVEMADLFAQLRDEDGKEIWLFIDDNDALYTTDDYFDAELGTSAEIRTLTPYDEADAKTKAVVDHFINQTRLL